MSIETIANCRKHWQLQRFRINVENSLKNCGAYEFGKYEAISPPHPYIYIYICTCICIKLRGRPPIWRQWARTDSCIWCVPLFSCRIPFVAPLVFFLRPVSCFRGARRSSMMFPCVFAASHKVRALFFSAGSLLGTFKAGFSLCFRVLDEFVGFRKACFAPFLHRRSAGAHICAR